MTRAPMPSMSEVPASVADYFARIERKIDENAALVAGVRERLRRMEQQGFAGDPSMTRRLADLEAAHNTLTRARIDKLEQTTATLVLAIEGLQRLTEALRRRVTMRSVAFGALTVAGSACGSAISTHLTGIVRLIGG